MKIYLATWLFEPSHGMALTKKQAKKRLVSYYFLTKQGINNSQLSIYCKSGKNSEK